MTMRGRSHVRVDKTFHANKKQENQKKHLLFADDGYVSFQNASETYTPALSSHRLAVTKKAAAFKAGEKIG